MDISSVGANLVSNFEASAPRRSGNQVNLLNVTGFATNAERKAGVERQCLSIRPERSVRIRSIRETAKWLKNDCYGRRFNRSHITENERSIGTVCPYQRTIAARSTGLMTGGPGKWNARLMVQSMRRY